ncbi:MAG: hypothetical protein EBT08_04850 [Betaproteobacteria bacterium]|nr:hypothetical protein [Betaproteobacteria bacterium]
MDTKTLMNPMIRLGARLAFLILASLAAVSAESHEYYADGFTVVHPWGEASEPQARDAPIYLILESITKNDRRSSGAAQWAGRQCASPLIDRGRRGG